MPSWVTNPIFDFQTNILFTRISCFHAQKSCNYLKTCDNLQVKVEAILYLCYICNESWF